LLYLTYANKKPPMVLIQSHAPKPMGEKFCCVRRNTF